MPTESSRLRSLTMIALSAALMAVCSFITVPNPFVPFTLQTFGLYVTILLLGGRRATLAVLLYLALGAVGLPVFSGFRGGIGALLGFTGGYLIGFLFCSLTAWGLEKLLPEGTLREGLSLAIGTLVCYAFGTAWFVAVYTGEKGPIGLMTVLTTCVLPFLIPDALKGVLALIVSGRLKRALPRFFGRRENGRDKK